MNELTELQTDFLTEIVNIAYGKATARIAQILDAFATMNVPKIRCGTRSVLIDEIKLELNEYETCYLTIQTFVGKFDGESIFLLGDTSAKNLVKHLHNPSDASPTQDSLVELTNIVTSLLVTEFANNLDSQVCFNKPSFFEINNQSSICEKINKECDRIIAIDTIMEFQEQDIHGHVYILTHDKSYDWLISTLDAKIKEFGL